MRIKSDGNTEKNIRDEAIAKEGLVKGEKGFDSQSKTPVHLYPNI